MDILFHFKGNGASLLMKGSYMRSVILFSLYCVVVHRIENVLNVGSIVTCTICSCGIHMGNHILLGTASFFFPAVSVADLLWCRVVGRPIRLTGFYMEMIIMYSPRAVKLIVIWG